MSNSQKQSVAAIIAARFISELEKGVAPWSRGFQSDAPRNAFSKREYRGVNYFLLSMLGVDYACTFNQARNAKGAVKKGAKGIPIVFWNFQKKEENGVEKKVAFMRYFTVFSMDNVENAAWIRPENVANNNARNESAESLFEKVRGVCSFTLTEGGNQPCFIPALNEIQMPKFDKWAQAPRFYKTLFHEAGHALGKVTGKQFANGGQAYATEELIAELFASVCMNLLGINSPECWDNSVAYVQGWAKRLTDEPQAIISAAQEAQKRLDLIFPRAEENEESAED